MRGRRKKGIIAVLALMAMLAGCGSKEVVMKEFTSKDQTVSIQMNEEWVEHEDIIEEDLRWAAEGWIAMTSENGAEEIIVAQLPKHIYNISDMDNFKELIKASYSVSVSQPVDSPSVSGMDVAETESCKITVENSTLDGRILYGQTKYAYYGIIYLAAVKINEAKEEYFNKVCASFQETAPEVEDTSIAGGSDTVQWFNNTCAVLTAVNGWDYTIFGGMTAGEGSKNIVQNLLSEWWEVTDRASADETMDWLLEEGHRVSFAEEMEYLAEAGVADAPAQERADVILANFEVDAEEADNYADWFTFYEQYGPDAMAGWDYSRAMSLLGYYYLAGYYTQEEALDKSLETAETIQETFDSWDDFMESYFIGYEYWAGESSDERREIYEEIKASSDDPFRLDWNMTFEKSW